MGKYDDMETAELEKEQGRLIKERAELSEQQAQINQVLNDRRRLEQLGLSAEELKRLSKVAQRATSDDER